MSQPFFTIGHATRSLDELGVRERRFGDSGDHGNPVTGHVVLGTDLVSHDGEGLGAGAHEHDAGVRERAGQLGILAQEPIARVHGLRAGAEASWAA